MSGVREIAFDTETTGFDARGADRLTEIGCVELIDFLPSGKTWHAYVKPDDVQLSEKITQITGLTTEFLADKPLFGEVADGFLDFVGDSPLIAHNADFDRGFINAALDRLDIELLPRKRFIDTLHLAREKFPGASNSLDALCKRFDISLASRTTHGALIDAELLAKVYLELRGGRARSFGFIKEKAKTESTALTTTLTRKREQALAPRITDEELAAHSVFVNDNLGEDPPWSRYK